MPTMNTSIYNNLLGSALVSTEAAAKAQWTERYKPYGDEMKEV